MKSASDAEFLRAAGVVSFNDPNFDRYSRRLQKLRDIKNYSYRMDVLEETMSYEEVTEILVRVNLLGAKLRSSDLALAQIPAWWPGSLALFRAFQAECDSLGFELDLGTHLRMMVALLTSQSKFKAVGSLSRADLEAGWARAQRAMRHAINLLRSHAAMDSPALLSSPLALIALGCWADKLEYRPSAKEAALMRRYILLANAKGRWSCGSSETSIDQAGDPPRRSRRPHFPKCPVQDDVPGIRSGWRAGLVEQARHLGQARGRPGPPAFPTHFPRGLPAQVRP